jgi:hypothetical protein
MIEGKHIAVFGERDDTPDDVIRSCCVAGGAKEIFFSSNSCAV